MYKNDNSGRIGGHLFFSKKSFLFNSLRQSWSLYIYISFTTVKIKTLLILLGLAFIRVERTEKGFSQIQKH